MQLAVVSYCLPSSRSGRSLMIVLRRRGTADGRSWRRSRCSSPRWSAPCSGCAAADRASLDLVHAYGGGRWQQLTKVRLIAALPSLFAALRIAAPAAVLGAIIGEYLGGVDTRPRRGDDRSRSSSCEIARTWGVALVAGLLAGLGVRGRRARRPRRRPVGRRRPAGGRPDDRTRTPADAVGRRCVRPQSLGGVLLHAAPSPPASSLCSGCCSCRSSTSDAASARPRWTCGTAWSPTRRRRRTATSGLRRASRITLARRRRSASSPA